MTLKKVTVLFCAFVMVGAAGFGSFHAYAAQDTPNVVTLSPATADIELESSDTKKIVTFTVQNQYSEPLLMRAQVLGIDDATGRIIPASELSANLAEVLSLSEEQFTIEPLSNYLLTLTVQNTPNLPAGGQYATVVLTQEKIGDAVVAVKQSISAGIFISKLDGQIKSIRLDEFTVSKSLFSLSKSAKIKLTNTGNVFITPRASVFVYKNGNEVLAKGITNQSSRRILQGGVYEEQVQINKITNSWKPTKVTITAEYRADGVNELQQVTQNYVYIPPIFVVHVIGLITLIGVGVIVAKQLLTRSKKKIRSV